MKRLDDDDPRTHSCKCGHTRAQHFETEGMECRANELHPTGAARSELTADVCPCEHFTRAILPRRGAQLSLPNVRPIFERKP